MASVAGRVQIRIFSNTRALSRTLFGSQIRRQLCTDSPDDTPNTILEIKADTKVATLSLNRYSGKNAFSKAMIIEFKESLSNLLAREGTSEQVSCLIIKSNVEKVFCAGADLKERAGMSESEVGPFVSTLRDTFTFLAELPFPTIAAMEGVALGGGFELALACDLRIAGVNAKVGLPEVALAIIPGAGGTQRLTRIVGPAKAKELIFTSKILSAESALSCGLVTECVESGWAYSRAVGNFITPFTLYPLINPPSLLLTTTT